MGVIAQLLQDDAVSQLSSEWLDQILATLLERIAEALAEGGTAEEIAARIKAILGDEHKALMIALTELNRAWNEGLVAAFKAAGIPKVRWVTHSADPCPECIENEAYGPNWLGQPFPSGAIAPPDHPHCQCELVPVKD